MIWLMAILRISPEEQFLIKYYVIKHLILLKIQNMMDIKRVLRQWFINLRLKKTSRGAVKIKIMSSKELAEEFHKPIIR